MSPVDVLIVSEELGVRDALRRLVAADPQLTVAAGAADAEAAASLLAHSPRAVVAIVDAHLAGGGGLAVAAIKHRAPQIEVVGFSLREDVPAVIDMLREGAIGALVGAGCVSELREAVHAAAAGSPRIAAAALAGLMLELRTDMAAERARRAEYDDLRARIERVVAGEGLSTVFQPIADLRSGRVVGLQALARFDGPPRQSPPMWLADAAKVGLGMELELAAVRAAFQGFRLLPDGAFLSVHVGPLLAISGRLIDELTIERAGQVVLEVTHHASFGEYASLAAALAPLRRMGVRLAVDDSGAGLSSLQEIAALSPDFLKLDRSLTRDIDSDSTRRALASTLLGIAGPVGSTVIAEGIETSAELSALRELGVAYGQGYLLGRPRSAAEHDSDVVQIELPRDAEAEATVLPGHPVRRTKRQEQAEHGFRETLELTFAKLERNLPDSVFAVTQIDSVTRTVRIIDARGPGVSGMAGFSAKASESFCHPMAAGQGPRLCGDISQEPQYARVPLGLAIGARSYAGVPIELDDGTPIGSVCALSRETDAYGEDTLGLLTTGSQAVLAALAREHPRDDGARIVESLRRYASSDWLTGLLNGGAFMELVGHHHQRARLEGLTSFLVAIEVPELAEVSARQGRAFGDLVVKDVANSLVGAGKPSDSFGRIDEGSFGALLAATGTDQAVRAFQRDFAAGLSELLRKRSVDTRVHAGSAKLLDADSAEAALAAARGRMKLVGIAPRAAAA